MILNYTFSFLQALDSMPQPTRTEGGMRATKLKIHPSMEGEYFLFDVADIFFGRCRELLRVKKCFPFQGRRTSVKDSDIQETRAVQRESIGPASYINCDLFIDIIITNYC